MMQHSTASIVIEKTDERTRLSKFLLIKRANTPERNYWAIPGGHVDEGETPLQAAIRESKEEVGGVEIVSKRSVYIFVHDIELGHRHKSHVFLGKATGRIAAKSDAKKLGWFTLQQMKNMNLTHYTKKVFNTLHPNSK